MRSSVCPQHGTTVPGARSRRDPTVVEPDIEYLNHSKKKIIVYNCFLFFCFLKYKNTICRITGVLLQEACDTSL